MGPAQYPFPGQPAYQNVLRDRLIANQQDSEQYREVIDQYRRLARTARELKIRNRALLRSGTGPSAGSEGLVTHLESQLTLLRNELSTLYRTQAATQNKQLQLSDSLRDRDEEVRGLREEIRVLREQKDMVGRREEEWGERWRARGRDVETLNDELLSLNLELTSLQQRNTALQTDNAQLLQRWLDRMQESVDGMNDDFEREAGVGGSGEVDVEGAGGGAGGGEKKEGVSQTGVTEGQRKPTISGPKAKPPNLQPSTIDRPNSAASTLRTTSGSKVDERRKMFETKSNGPNSAPNSATGKEGFRSGGKANLSRILDTSADTSNENAYAHRKFTDTNADTPRMEVKDMDEAWEVISTSSGELEVGGTDGTSVLDQGDDEDVGGEGWEEARRVA